MKSCPKKGKGDLGKNLLQVQSGQATPLIIGLVLTTGTYRIKKNHTFITSAMVSGQEEMIPWWERGSAAALVEELSHSLCETLLSRTLAVTRSRHRIMQDTHAQTCYLRYALDPGMCQCSCGASTTWLSRSALVPDSWWRFEAPLKLR